LGIAGAEQFAPGTGQKALKVERGFAQWLVHDLALP
jgi:hypothetical protein